MVNVDQLVRVPEGGHPFGESEILASDVGITNIITALQKRGLLVESEAGIEVTPKGKSVRATIRFKPHEGLLSKLLNVFSLKVDMNLKDLFK